MSGSGSILSPKGSHAVAEEAQDCADLLVIVGDDGSCAAQAMKACAFASAYLFCGRRQLFTCDKGQHWHVCRCPGI